MNPGAHNEGIASLRRKVAKAVGEAKGAVSVGRALIRPYSLARLCRKARANCAKDSGYAGDWRTVGVGSAQMSDLVALRGFC